MDRLGAYSRSMTLPAPPGPPGPFDLGGWPAHPVIYEVPAWQWLNELGREEQRRVTLADVPSAAWDAVVPRGVDVVWLMGVWERSPIGHELALAAPGVRAAIAAALDTDADEEVAASPYCVRRFTVDPFFGGRSALAVARGELAARGARLLLDFVPNHVARDHPWVLEHPARSCAAAPTISPPTLTSSSTRRPVRSPWAGIRTTRRGPTSCSSTRSPPRPRQLAVTTLLDIAEQCDGVRCDMAMLLLDDVAQATWGSRVGDRLDQPYWEEVIGHVRAERPGFMFIAEAYWGREADLLAQGFDLCYDKAFLDALVAGDVGAVREHVESAQPPPGRLVRFLENHDEPRAAARLGPGPLRAASVMASTLPGGLLLLDGQLRGAAVQVPVQASRRPAEQTDGELERWWSVLLSALHDDAVRTGEWSPLALRGLGGQPLLRAPPRLAVGRTGRSPRRGGQPLRPTLRRPRPPRRHRRRRVVADRPARRAGVRAQRRRSGVGWPLREPPGVGPTPVPVLGRDQVTP